MRTFFFFLPVAMLACTTAQPANVMEAPDMAASQARIVSPDFFNDPDCMVEYLDIVDAIEAQYTEMWLQQREEFVRWYQDARAQGASQAELNAIRGEANQARQGILGGMYGELAGLEQQLCPTDYCDQYPQDPNCYYGCDPAAGEDCSACDINPDSEECFCEQNPDECGQVCSPGMTDQECECMLNPDACPPDCVPGDAGCCDPDIDPACN